MAGAFPHKPGETVYYVRQYGYTFPVKKIDEKTGRAVQKTNPATGQPLFLPDGNPDVVEKFYDFTRWRTKFCTDGYVSVFIINDKTDPLVKAEVEKQAADRGSQVMTEKQFIRSVIVGTNLDDTDPAFVYREFLNDAAKKVNSSSKGVKGRIYTSFKVEKGLSALRHYIDGNQITRLRVSGKGIPRLCVEHEQLFEELENDKAAAAAKVTLLSKGASAVA